MRRITALTIGIIMLGFIMVTTAAAVDSKKEISVDAAEQVILDFLYQPTAAAVAEHYGEPTQFWHPEILSIRKLSDAQGHEVVIQVETFQGPHNPPYGLETITFYVSPTGQPQLVRYDHRDAYELDPFKWVRISPSKYPYQTKNTSLNGWCFWLVGDGGFEPPKA